MAEEKIKSGPEIVKDFIANLKSDDSLDKGTLAVIYELHTEDKLTQTKLQQGLSLKRSEALKHD